MKDLTRIEPEPEVKQHLAEHDLKWMSEAYNHSKEDYGQIIRLLIHKVNELTSEVNRMKADNK